MFRHMDVPTNAVQAAFGKCGAVLLRRASKQDVTCESGRSPIYHYNSLEGTRASGGHLRPQVRYARVNVGQGCTTGKDSPLTKVVSLNVERESV